MQKLKTSSMNKNAAAHWSCLAIVIATIGITAFARPSISAVQPAGWPTIELPADADSFSISDELSTNGVPMQLRGFITKKDVASTVAWFRAKLGQPLTENQIGRKTILGRPDGDYYVTVQIEPSEGGVRGLIGVSNMRQALYQRQRSSAVAEAWIRDLPANTKIMNIVTSQDDGKSSTYVLASNQLSDSLNAQRATRALERRGFVVERKAALDKGKQINGSFIEASGEVVLFKSPNREATVMAFHDTTGKAALVISTVQSTEHSP